MLFHKVMCFLLYVAICVLLPRIEWRWFCRRGWKNGFSFVAGFMMAASAAVGVGTGTQITFGTTSFTSNLKAVQWSGIKRKAIDSSYMGTTIVASPNTTSTGFGSMTFIPSSLSDPGSLKLTFQFNPDKIPIIDSSAETVTVTFPKGTNTTGAKWAGSGFVTDFEVNDPLEDIMIATVTVKMSGNVSFTAAV